MSTADVRDLIRDLPPKMQDAITGYVEAVEIALPRIERDAAVRFAADDREIFLFLVAVRRIWFAIEGQFNLIGASISLAEKREIDGFQLGGTSYTRGSDAAYESQRLRTQFDNLIREMNLEACIDAGDLSDLASEVARRPR